MERVALKGMPFPPDGSDDNDLSAELKKMKAVHPEGDVEQKQAAPAQDSAPAAQAALDQPQIVSAQQVAHMKAWSPADLDQARKTQPDSSLGKPAPQEDQPKVVQSADLPHKTPWSTLASEEADKLAHEAELQAAQAQIDAKNKQSLFEKEDTAADKVAADDAAKDAEELALRAKVAEEIAAEQAQWAVEQGELRTANHILAQDPELWNVDENTTLPKT